MASFQWCTCSDSSCAHTLQMSCASKSSDATCSATEGCSWLAKGQCAKVPDWCAGSDLALFSTTGAASGTEVVGSGGSLNQASSYTCGETVTYSCGTGWKIKTASVTLETGDSVTFTCSSSASKVPPTPQHGSHGLNHTMCAWACSSAPPAMLPAMWPCPTGHAPSHVAHPWPSMAIDYALADR